jgi:hypothetical protein
MYVSPTTDSALPLDLRRLTRARQAGGTVTWTGGSAIAYRLDLAAARLTLDYLVDGSPLAEPITLCSTSCHLGGERWWARCPRCDERIAVLYLAAGRFRCRACHRLAYQSTRETPFNRACRRAQKLRHRVGARHGIGDELPPKPRGMWARTFDRHRAAIDAADRRALSLAGVLLSREERRHGQP